MVAAGTICRRTRRCSGQYPSRIFRRVAETSATCTARASARATPRTRPRQVRRTVGNQSVKLIRLMLTVAGIGLLASGCYTLQPSLAAVPAPGTRLAFTINDVGRVALGGSMGPELLRVDGHLQSKDGDDYMVNVAGVELLQGGYQTWAGETVRINSS